MMICLLLSGCQYPDDDVDMPEPQKPVSELIQGTWNHISTTGTVRDDAGNVIQESTSYQQDYDVYSIDEENVIIYNNPEHHDNYGGESILSESGGKHYIEWNDKINGYAKYEITAISDTKMTWEMNDSLAAISDQYSEQAAELKPNRLYIKQEFTKRIKHPLEDKVKGAWLTDTTTKVTYDTAGNIIKKEGYPNETYAYDIFTDYLSINLNEQAQETINILYSLEDRDGKTYLEYDDDNTGTTVINEIISLSDDKMIWERKMSPTVSYIIELTYLF